VADTAFAVATLAGSSTVLVGLIALARRAGKRREARERRIEELTRPPVTQPPLTDDWLTVAEAFGVTPAPQVPVPAAPEPLPAGLLCTCGEVIGWDDTLHRHVHQVAS
jgi:hypothetical protein